MSDSGGPLPQRIGDAERDQATEFLREHLAQGRLDAAEFDERLSAALNARVQPELDRLFLDLPSPTPSSPGTSVTPTQPAQSPQPVPDPYSNLLSPRTHHTIDIAVGLLWPVTIAFIFFVSGWDQWWLLFAPMVASSIWGRRKQQDKEEREQLRKQLQQPGDDQ